MEDIIVIETIAALVTAGTAIVGTISYHWIRAMREMQRQAAQNTNNQMSYTYDMASIIAQMRNVAPQNFGSEEGHEDDMGNMMKLLPMLQQLKGNNKWDQRTNTNI